MPGGLCVFGSRARRLDQMVGDDGGDTSDLLLGACRQFGTTSSKVRALCSFSVQD